jgi:hypothetical protein
MHPHALLQSKKPIVANPSSGPAAGIQQLASWRGVGSVVTHQIPIGNFDGPHPSFGPDGKLL